MSLRDMMDADLVAIAADTGELGQTATLADSDGTPSGSIACVVGDQNENMMESGASVEVHSTLRILCSRTAAITILGREPRRADTFTFASGADAGEWCVESIASDVGNGINCQCIRSRRRDVGQRGHREQ